MARKLVGVKREWLVDLFCQNQGTSRKVLTLFFLVLLFVAVLPFQGYPGGGPTYPISSDVKTTRERTVRPLKLPEDTKQLKIFEVDQYKHYGYSSWFFGDPVDYGLLLPDGSPVSTYSPVEKLLRFFSISDTHITDKESPAQPLFFGLMGDFGNVDLPAYSPVMLYTTHVLDAAVQTVNALHKTMSFDFGIGLGDPANSNLYNGLRWHIDVLDGKRIVPSSGAHKGANTIDYQKPFQSEGLDSSIPWYQVIGNHDQYWSGALYPNDYLRNMLVGRTILNMGVDGSGFPSLDARGIYTGVIDGSTPYGSPVYFGLASTMKTPPTVVPDRNRRALTTDRSSSLNWMREFFNTTSKPKGHGFTRENLDHDFVSYTFEPKASVPLKVIVLDDTCKQNPFASDQSYSHGCLDQQRYDWLVNELDKGQAEGKLMIIAAHVPVGPQLNVPDAPAPPEQDPPLSNSTVIPMFFSTSKKGAICGNGYPIENCAPVIPYTIVSDAMLLDTLHNYSNLILWMAGHRHINTVTPQPAPDGKGPEFGFWEVETPSTRDFPQQFRTFEIVRNDNNTISIFVTNVDPAIQDTGSPAETSRGYAIGVYRIAAGIPGLTDTNPHVYNAELIKPLATPFTMTVTTKGAGTVISSPYSGINCAANSTCTATYLPGTRVTLIASPSVGASFAGWIPCAGQSTCTIEMTSDVTVMATFNPVAPTLTVAPTYKDFGTRPIGIKSAAIFTVRNTPTKGVADLTIGNTVINGTDAGQFALVPNRDGCSGETIKSGKSCTFWVSFTPASQYTKTATITIPSNDPNSPVSIQITGVGK